MRIRQIKPSVCTNDDLAELGPYSYILFTGLWMIADRAGRFEYRPRRIKGLVMPLWEECPVSMIETLVEKLVEKGMLQVYTIGLKTFVQITEWAKHQRPDSREGKSEIPPPSVGTPDGNGASSAESTAYGRHCNYRVEHGNYTAQTWEFRLGTGNWELGMCSVYSSSSCSVLGGCRGEPADRPPMKTRTPEPPVEAPVAHPVSHPPETRSAPPCRMPDAAHAVAAIEPEAAPASVRSSRPAATQPEPSQRIDPPGEFPAVTLWPQRSEDFALMRESLNQLARELNMPRPDDGIIRRVIDSAYGASVQEIHALLVALYQRQKFRSIRSWGLLPLVVSQQFRVA